MTVKHFWLKIMSRFPTISIFRKILPIIWLQIILEFDSKIPSQKKSDFRNVFELFLGEILKLFCMNDFYLQFPETYQK
jgi:hypothetical protein